MTVPTDQCLDPENGKIFAVSYVIIFVFHPDLHIEHVIIERSFEHSLKSLADLSYLMQKQHKFSKTKNDDTFERLRAICQCEKWQGCNF